MVAFIRIVLSFLLAAMAFDGTKMSKMSALGLDASRADRNARRDRVSDHHTSALPDSLREIEELAGADAGAGAADKGTRLRGSKGGVDTNAPTEIGPNNADGTVSTTKIERSDRPAGALTNVGLHVDGGEGADDNNFVGVGRVLQDCSTVASWHPQYSAGWDGGYCTFEATCNSPGYASELVCCKSAFAGQTSGYCLSKLEAPPTTSPTTSDFTVDFWYPDYETAWTSAGCLNTLPLPYNNINDRPNYPTQLECCKGVYAGQMSGACLSKLESPPTTSPTNTGNTGSLYYPDYETAWPEAGCVNVLPVPSGRPTYTSQLACCKGAYGGQISGVCLSQLDSPPTTSPTSTGGLDVYYPDYETAWDKAACVNTRPMPSGRPVYSTMLACCKGAYAGQMSGYCLSQLEAPPTTSPTSSDATADFWYPDYDSDWSGAGCLNSLPLPYLPGGRPTYTTNEACCSAAYGGQVSRACLCSMASPPAGCPTMLPLPTPPPTPPPSTSPTPPPTPPPSTSPTPPPTPPPSTSPTPPPTPPPSTSPTPPPTPPPTPAPTKHPFTDSDFKTAFQQCVDPNVSCQYDTAIGDWDVSRVEDFSLLFVDGSWNQIAGADSFNEPINWNTGSATNMQGMFYGAAAFNQPLPATFDTAKVTTINDMFRFAAAFNQDLSTFDTAKVKYMNSMFRDAAAFNQPLSTFDTSSVIYMHWMFKGATAFDQDLCHFGDNFSQYASWVDDMFAGSGCANTNNPTSATGPWCAVTTCPP